MDAPLNCLVWPQQASLTLNYSPMHAKRALSSKKFKFFAAQVVASGWLGENVLFQSSPLQGLPGSLGV